MGRILSMLTFCTSSLCVCVCVRARACMRVHVRERERELRRSRPGLHLTGKPLDASAPVWHGAGRHQRAGAHQSKTKSWASDSLGSRTSDTRGSRSADRFGPCSATAQTTAAG
jgi:hypothetical protein